MKHTKTKKNTKIILGSASPRRKEIFERLKLDFKIIPPDIKEEQIKSWLNDIQLQHKLKEIAEQKYNAVLKKADKGSLVFCFDTTVCAGKFILGKPESKNHAEKMLKFLSGRKHSVYTACAAGRDGNPDLKIYKTKIYFKNLSETEIKNYIDDGEYTDAAGAYKIQDKGLSLIKKIKGPYFNVVGLPLEFLWQHLY